MLGSIWGTFFVSIWPNWEDTRKTTAKIRRQETDHNHQHIKYKSRSLERLIRMVVFGGAQFKSWPEHGLHAMTSFVFYSAPLDKNVCMVGEPPIGSQPLPAASFPNHDSPPTLTCSDKTKKSIAIYKLRKPKSLSIISCKRRHYSNCIYVAIFLNNNSVGYTIKLVHKLTEQWVESMLVKLL